MNRHLKSFLLAFLLSLLTVLFCLVIADGFIGVKGFQVDHGDGTGTIYRNIRIGEVVFWIFMVGLPLVFARFVKWRYTVPNLLWYFLLYFPPYYGFGHAPNHGLLYSGGFFVMPAWASAALTAIMFFVIQSVVYLVYNLIRAFIELASNIAKK